MKKQRALAEEFERKAMEARHNAEAIAYKFILDQNHHSQNITQQCDEDDQEQFQASMWLRKFRPNDLNL